MVRNFEIIGEASNRVSEKISIFHSPAFEVVNDGILSPAVS